MTKLNDFEKMCKMLNDNKSEKCMNCEHIDYICAKNAVSKYCGDNKDKLLNLKGEAQKSDFMQYLTLMISITSLCFSGLSVYCSAFGLYKWIMILFCIFVVWCLIKVNSFMKKYMNINYWRNHILNAIESINKEKFSEKTNHQ